MTNTGNPFSSPTTVVTLLNKAYANNITSADDVVLLPCAFQSIDEAVAAGLLTPLGTGGDFRLTPAGLATVRAVRAVVRAAR